VLKIQGRRLDYLYTADGIKIQTWYVANLFKNMQKLIIISFTQLRLVCKV
jgi:hypothetical protein